MSYKLELTRGERKVVSILIRKGSLTWSELLEASGLSRPGLSKILKSLKSNDLVCFETKEYKGKQRVAYKSRVKSLVEAETILFYKGFVTWLESARTYKEVKEYLEEDLPDLLYYIFSMYLYESIAKGDPKKPVNNLAKGIKSLFRVLIDTINRNKRIRKKILDYYRREFGEF